jgi:Tol biopolymer transport system component
MQLPFPALHTNAVHRLSAWLRSLFCIVSVAITAMFVSVAAAQCPFNVAGLAAPTAMSDGVLFVRAAQGATSTALTAGTGSTRAATDISADIAANALRLDINGSGGFDISDAAIIARFLTGLRGDSLIPGGAGAGATRTLAEIEGHIAGGCPAPVVTGRSGQMAYYFLNDIFSVNMSTLLSQLRLTDNDFDLKFVGHALGPNNALAVTYNVDNVGNNSRLEIYRADNSLENAFNYSFRFDSAPFFSPDGQTIGFLVRIESGQLGVPASFVTAFYRRSDGVLIAGFTGTFFFGWMPDGRPMFKLPEGVRIANSLLDVNTGPIIPNTADAQNFSVSPDATKIAFIAAASASAQRHVYMADINGSNRRQVTTSRVGEETQVLFSPNGSELLLKTDTCALLFNTTARIVQLIPANSTLLDVTASSSPYVLRINANQRICADGPLSWR